MKIGILQCDSVKPQFQGRHGDYPAMVTSLFHRVDSTIEFTTYDVVAGSYPASTCQYDAFVTTGSKASVYDGDAWIADLQNYLVELRRAEKTLIAICFGHQLVAQAFGGRVENSDKGWGVGVHTMEVVSQQSWMSPPLEQCNVLVSHQDQVVELPRGAELIAGSEFCPNAMFQLDRSIVTIQGHPEFSKPYAQDLMGFRRELLGEAVYTAGINSLLLPTDEHSLARWFIEFISGAHGG